ncbi:MAG: hypothetical protein JWM02_902, partial [Frankiales bacterium]|nr:hypothetical protein [Frankiales bacterium]
PGRPLQTQRYDSADLQVSGNRWTLLRGGGGSCRGVKAVAVAQLLGVQASTVPTTSATAAPGAAVPPSQSGSANTSTDGTSAPADRASASASTRGGDVVPVVGGLLVVLLAAGALILRRCSTPNPA